MATIPGTTDTILPTLDQTEMALHTSMAMGYAWGRIDAGAQREMRHHGTPVFDSTEFALAWLSYVKRTAGQSRPVTIADAFRNCVEGLEIGTARP